MPRASGSAKRQQGAANGHRDSNTRQQQQQQQHNENGGAVGGAGGKRLAKQKSQSQLDGGAGKAALADNATSIPALPTSPTIATNGSAKCPEENGNMAMGHKTTEALRRGSLGTYSGSSSTDSLLASPNHHAEMEVHRRIDVNDVKNSAVHRDTGSALDLVQTVLRSSPLSDTIAILLILMQVSPVTLTTIFILFTFLTFVPPVTTSSGLSLIDIFEGFVGTPAIGTIVGVDFIMLLIWLFLWAPMQQFVLDLAQVVISITLGGGTGSREATPNNIILCVGIVLFTQWTRRTGVGGKLHSLSSYLSNNPLSAQLNDSLESPMRSFEKKGPYGWVRSVLAVHIVTQGLVRYIREWYLRREKRDAPAIPPEVDAARANAAISDLPPEIITSPPSDTDGSTQPMTPSVSSSKKRKKQSAQVRTRQPLWAALASTKIVMVKEYELSHAASEFTGSGQLDIHDLGNTPFNTQPEQIWICYVGSDEVCFSTSQFPNAAAENGDSNVKSGQPNVDETKPFYVKVNGAVWQPTRIVPLQEDDEATDGRRWSGDIYGLTPMSNYECEFVSTRTGEVIFSTSVKTIQARRSKEPEVGKPPAQPTAPRPQARRDSPATTLKASIAASEAKNAELKAQLKNLRKENKAKSNAYKRDIDKLTAACQSTGSNDDRYRQKIAQNNTSQKQAEQSILDLDKELKEMETLPEDLVAKQRAAKARYDEEKAAFEGARASFKSFKSSLEAEISAVDSEVSTLQTKRDKFASRIAKLESERERIVDANARGVDEAERKRQDRITLEADIARINRMWQQRINETQARNAQKGAYAASLATAIKSYVDNVAQSNGDAMGSYDLPGASVPSASPVSYSPWTSPPSAQHGPSLSHSSWSSPAASIPQSLYPPHVSQSHFPNPLFQPQQQHQAQPFPSFQQQQTNQTSYQPPKARGRSSSMLSDVSGFTQGSSPDDENANTVVLPQSSQSQAFQPNPLQAGVSNPSPLASHPPGLVFGNHAHAPTSPSIRIPPGFATSVGAGRLRQRSDGGGSGSGSNGSGPSGGSGGSGSGSVGSARSSVRSGSGSGGSVKDPTSPI